MLVQKLSQVLNSRRGASSFSTFADASTCGRWGACAQRGKESAVLELDGRDNAVVP